MIPKTTKVQTLLLCKDYFNKASAKKWAKQHGYKYGKVDETKRQYRLRQEDPSEFQPASFRTVEFRPGVQAVIARPLSNPGKGKTMAKKKKARKKKATKKRATKKRATKKKATKKKATKKKRNPGRKNNSTPTVKLELKPMGKTISSSAPQNLYHAYVKNGRDKMYIGHVTAKNATEAKRKARAYLRKKV